MLSVFDIPTFIHAYGYVGIFLIVFLESGIFPPLPGDSLLFTAGLFASVAGFNIILLLLIIFFATFLGATLGYTVGFHMLKLQNKFFFNKILKQENIERAEKFFEQYGKKAVTFARFVPFMRTFIPIVAGVTKMDYNSFLRYNAVGAFLWSFIITFAGYFLGQTFPIVKDYLWVVVVLIIVVSLIPFVAEFLRHKSRNKKKI
jgi:membrane-associated protein